MPGEEHQRTAIMLQTRPSEPRQLDDSVPADVAEVELYRRAARLIVRDAGRATKDRLIAVVKLAEKAKTQAKLPEWCRRAVWEESAAFLQGRKDAPLPSTEPIEAAVRSLHAKGLIRCPTCRLLLPDEATLDRWRSLRLAEALSASNVPRAGR